MSKGKKNMMDQDFHDRFGGWEAQPSPDAWEKIERRLDGKEDRKPAFWWWFAGIGVLLIIGTVGTWLLWPNKNVPIVKQVVSTEKNQNATTKSVVESTPDNSGGTTNKNEDKNQSQQDSPNTKAIVNTRPNKDKQIEKKNPIIKNEVQAKIYNTPINESAMVAINSYTANRKNTAHPSNKVSAVDSSNSKPVTQKETATIENDNKAQPSADSKNVPPVLKDSTNNKQTAGLSESKDSISGSESLISSSVSSPNKQPEIIASTKKTDSVLTKTNQVDTTKKPKADSVLLVVKDTSNKPNEIPITDTTKKADSLANNSKDTTKIKKAPANFFSFSLYGSPEFASSNLITNNTAFDIKSEKYNPQLAIGLKVSYNFSKRVELSIGATYSQTSVNYQSNQYLYFNRYTTQPYVFSSSYGDMPVPQAVMLEGFSPLAPPSVTQFSLHGYQYSQTLQFINIPVNVRFNIATGKFKTYAALGLNIQCALGEKAQVELIKELQTDVITFNSLNTQKINFAPTISIGGEYDFAKHFAVFLEPNARYNLLSSSSNTSVKSNASFIGCALGLRVNL